MAELAKIVTGRATGSSTASRRAAPEPTPSRASSGDALSDLEAELMSDLQASFASVRDVPPPPAPPTQRAAPPPERPVPAPPPAPTPRMIAVEEEEIEIEEDLLQDDGVDEPVSFAPPPAFVPPPPRATVPEPPQLRRQLEEQPIPRLVPTTPIIQPVTNESPPAERTPERPLRTARAPSSDRLDIAGMAMRPSVGAASPSASPGQAPSTPPPVARQPHSRWERPEPAKPQNAAASRFAPPAKSAPSQGQDEDDLFGAGGIFAEAADSDPNDGPFDAIDTASEYPDEDVRPTFREDDVEKLAKRRGSRAPLMIIGVIGVVVLGGIAVAMLRPTGESASPPPVIVANTDPTKITPEEPAATDDQNKLSYDRINSSDTNSDTTLLTPGDEQIADVGTGENDNPITRVIIPAGPGFDQPALDASSADARQAAPNDAGIGALAANDEATAADGEELGPRRVRTVVVKPDGTIVESASAEEGAPAPTLPTQTAAADPQPLPEPEPPRPVNDDTAAIAGTTADGELAITPDATVDDLSAPATVPPPAPAAAAPQPEPQQVAAAPTNETPPSETVRATTAGGSLVQVSSQRTEDAAMATFRDLQARYPSILGQYQPNVQRADIPDRGTFFRVRVGPFSNGDAQRLCNDLKSAGGDCIIAQR